MFFLKQGKNNRFSQQIIVFHKNTDFNVSRPNDCAALVAHYLVSQTLDMPASLMNLLLRFLQSGGGKLSQRARSKEFAKLTASEVEMIVAAWQRIFLG